MYYEDVAIKKGDTLSGLAAAYGYKASQWRTIWNDPKNAKLKALRNKPELIQPGDNLLIPINWRVINTTMTHVQGNSRVSFSATRDGEDGRNIRWAQTVDRSNQPFGEAPYGRPRLVVDPSSPPDDNKPFYFTDLELQQDPSRRNTFRDTPFRDAPEEETWFPVYDWARAFLGRPVGTTQWRAMLSIAIVTDKRVTVTDTHYWGFDKDPKGTVTKIPARKASGGEIAEHLDIMRKGFGLKDLPGTKAFFKDMGWTFRLPPSP